MNLYDDTAMEMRSISCLGHSSSFSIFFFLSYLTREKPMVLVSFFKIEFETSFSLLYRVGFSSGLCVCPHSRNNQSKNWIEWQERICILSFSLSLTHPWAWLGPLHHPSHLSSIISSFKLILIHFDSFFSLFSFHLSEWGWGYSTCSSQPHFTPFFLEDSPIFMRVNLHLLTL